MVDESVNGQTRAILDRIAASESATHQHIQGVSKKVDEVAKDTKHVARRVEQVHTESQIAIAEIRTKVDRAIRDDEEDRQSTSSKLDVISEKVVALDKDAAVSKVKQGALGIGGGSLFVGIWEAFKAFFSANASGGPGS